MRFTSFLAHIVSLSIAQHYGMCSVSSSQSGIVAGLHWGNMKTYIRFITQAHVRFMEEDLFVPGNILYTCGGSLWTTDGKTKDQFVGKEMGYIEGIGAQARFGDIRGFLQTNSTHVLTVDWRNHCVRYVNRITNETSPFVGNCTVHGYSDGQYMSSMFWSPNSIIRNHRCPGEAIVTDGNYALRSIALATGYVGTVIKDLPAYPLGVSFDSEKENIFIIFANSMGKFNFETSSFSEVTPIENRGVVDGEFNLASFGNAKGILCMDKVCIVTDIRSQKLRIIDFSSQSVYSICPGTVPLVNEDTTNCSLRGPHSLLLRSNTLYVGEYQGIRSIPVRRVFPCEEIAGRLSSTDEKKCVQEIIGHDICLPPDIIRYSIQERNCTIKVNITEDVCLKKPCINSGICIAGGNDTYFCQCREWWSGTYCPIGHSKTDSAGVYAISLGVVIPLLLIITALGIAAYFHHRRKRNTQPPINASQVVRRSGVHNNESLHVTTTANTVLPFVDGVYETILYDVAEDGYVASPYVIDDNSSRANQDD